MTKSSLLNSFVNLRCALYVIDLLGRPPYNGSPVADKEHVPDDASDVTPTADGYSWVKDRQKDENTVRFRYVPNRDTGKPAVSPRIVHLHWMNAIQDEFGENVQTMDNHNGIVPKIDLLRWTEIQHNQHFNVH